MDLMVNRGETLAAAQRRPFVGSVVVSLIIVPPLLAFVMAGFWLIWTFVDEVLGSQGANLTVLILLAGTLVISRRTGDKLTGKFMLIACGGLIAFLLTPSQKISHG